jgi:hypothetical protein
VFEFGDDQSRVVAFPIVIRQQTWARYFSSVNARHDLELAHSYQKKSIE